MRRAAILFSCLAVLLPTLLVPQPAIAKKKDAVAPQMVWISYADGDVKFSPGHNGRPQLGKDWIAANVGQVIEDGYTLVTEQGRAEVEFEDGSVAYLAEHSALAFDSLLIYPNRMETELALLTGKATVAHASTNELDLASPEVTLHMMQPQTTTIESALDGVVIEATEGAQVIERGAWFGVLQQGEAIAYVEDHVAIPLPGKQKTPEEETWEQWVSGRLTTRRAQIAEGLKASGMDEPIPGLAGMVATGEFFDCPPYGKCWQPNEGSTSQATDNPGETEPNAAARGGKIVINRTMLMRCPLEAWNAADRKGKRSPILAQYGPCFAGSWDYSDLDRCGGGWDSPHGYWPWQDCTGYRYPTWVAGRRHRHECHIVKVKGHGIGLVPRHPLDREGHPPENAKTGVLVLTAEKGLLKAGVEPPATGLEQATRVPREFQRGMTSRAPRATPPIIEAKMASALLPRGTLSPQQMATMKNVSAIHFDFKSQSFVGRTGAVSHTVFVAHSSSAGFSAAGSHGSSSAAGGSNGGGHSGGGSSGGGAAAAGGHH